MQLNEALRINPGYATARRALDMAACARKRRRRPADDEGARDAPPDRYRDRASGSRCSSRFVDRPVRHFDFVQLDDPEYVTENPQVLRGFTLEGLRWALTTDTPRTGIR